MPHTYHYMNALTNFLYYEELAEAETASTAESNANLLILGSGTVVIEHFFFFSFFISTIYIPLRTEYMHSVNK